MRISLLIRREPFNQILIDTLIHYIGSQQPEKFQISFSPLISIFSFRVFNYAWTGNHYLNCYINTGSKAKLLDVLVKEYSHSQSKIKKPLQWLFVHLAVTHLGRIFLSQNILLIKPTLEILKDTVILGGNHRLRLLEPNKKKTLIVLKSGFRNLWIKNEIDARTSFKISFAPKILNIDDENTWFSEEYCLGIPVNRLSNNEGEKLSWSALEQLYQEFIIPFQKEVELGTWLISSKERILDQFSAGFVNNPPAKLSENLTQLLDDLSAWLSDTSFETIKVSNSHGDFQYANILKLADAEIKVIDWESTDTRWTGYDCLTLMLKARTKKGIVDFDTFTSIVSSNINLHSFLDLLPTDIIQIKHQYFLYCIEELGYQVLNTCEPAFYEPGKGLLEFIISMKVQLNSLKKY